MDEEINCYMISICLWGFWGMLSANVETVANVRGMFFFSCSRPNLLVTYVSKSWRSLANHLPFRLLRRQEYEDDIFFSRDYNSMPITGVKVFGGEKEPQSRASSII